MIDKTDSFRVQEINRLSRKVEKEHEQQIVVFYTSDKKNFQIIKPSPQFEGGCASLVEAISNSSIKQGVKNYDHYEVR